MIDEGNWKARGGEATLAFTRGGKQQVAVEIILLEGPSAGSRTTWYGYFGPSDEAFERTVESLRLLGWQGDDFSDLRGIGSTEVIAVIAHEQNPETGEVRARVKWINDVGGVAVTKRLDAGEAAAFAASMRGKLHAFEQRNKQPRPAAQRAAGAPAAGAQTRVTDAPLDDDIPF